MRRAIQTGRTFGSLFPSLMETYGVAVGEAMACALPVVASNVGGIPEQVAPGTGVLVEAKNEQALAEGILGVLNDPQREAMGQRARDHAVNNLSWDRCALQLLRGVIPQMAG